MVRKTICSYAVAVASAAVLGCDVATQLDNYEWHHAIIRGTVRQESGDAASGAQVDFFGFLDNKCAALPGADAVHMGQTTTNGQGFYIVRAQAMPNAPTITVCVVARASFTVGTQTKGQTVSGISLQLVPPDARPDTATIDIVLPP